MMIKLVRIGRDAELKTVGGKAVLNVSVVYDVGYGDNKKAQWLRLALWGDRAEKVASHMTKGKQIVVRVDDLHVREYDGKEGKAFSLEGTLAGFDFVSDGQRGQAAEPAPASAPMRQHAPAASADVDDDLPF